MGFDHIITKKGMPSASADFGLTALAYNLRRIFNIKQTAQRPFYILLRLSSGLRPVQKAINMLERYVREYRFNPIFIPKPVPNHKKQLI